MIASLPMTRLAGRRGARVLLVLVHAAAAVTFGIAVSEIGRWDEWHHVYIGIALGALGWWIASAAAPRWRLYVGITLLALGAWIAWDDAVSHTRQARDPRFPRSGPRGHLDHATSWWHRLAHRARLI